MLASDLHRWESPNVTFLDPGGQFPVFWESAEDCLVADVDGNTFLDLTAAFGVAAVGHTNPRVARAIADQSARLIHGMGDVHPTRLKVDLARAIAERTPGDLGGCIFGQNGGDAVEAALKTARLFTGKSGVLAFEGGYHGLTFGALAVTSRADFREPFAGQVPTFARHVPFAADGGAIAAALESDGTIGAVIVEPIQGRSGIVEPPPGWLAGLRQLCDDTACS
jgi:4-aminobutyrate aminotransferase-like enzyme